MCTNGKESKGERPHGAAAVAEKEVYENLMASMRVVVPLVILMLAGNVTRRAGILNAPVVERINDLVFNVFLPCMLFTSAYTAPGGVVAGTRFMWFSVASLVLVFFAVNLLVRPVDKRPAVRAALAHGIFRGNSVVYGSPLALSLLGAEDTARVMGTLGILICVSNILGILCVELQLARRIDVPGMLWRLVKNPIVISIVLGLALKGIGIQLPEILLSPINTLGTATTGVAFVALGASFTLSATKDNAYALIFANVTRLVLLPAVVLWAGAAVFGFRGYEIVALICLFATPAAISTGPVARSMGADGDLADEIIVTTTVLSIASLFSIIFLLKTVGVL